MVLSVFPQMKVSRLQLLLSVERFLQHKYSILRMTDTCRSTSEIVRHNSGNRKQCVFLPREIFAVIKIIEKRSAKIPDGFKFQE